MRMIILTSVSFSEIKVKMRIRLIRLNRVHLIRFFLFQL